MTFILTNIWTFEVCLCDVFVLKQTCFRLLTLVFVLTKPEEAADPRDEFAVWLERSKTELSIKAVLNIAACHLYNQLSQVCSMVGVLAEEVWPVNTDVGTSNDQPDLMMKHVITAVALFHNRKKPKLH